MARLDAGFAGAVRAHDGGSRAQLPTRLIRCQTAERIAPSTEHFFFPKFSISANPTAFFAAAAQRTKRINFRTLLHVLPFHNPIVLAHQIAVTDILLEGRYEFGVGRGHGWMPTKAGMSRLRFHSPP